MHAQSERYLILANALRQIVPTLDRRAAYNYSATYISARNHDAVCRHLSNQYCQNVHLNPDQAQQFEAVFALLFL